MLNNILNSRITSITLIHDYFQIGFDDGKVLNIYNKYGFKNMNDLKDLIYKNILKVEQKKSFIDLILTNNIHLHIGLTEDDFNGPEALEIFYPDGNIDSFHN